MSQSMDHHAAEALRRAFVASGFGTYDRRSTDRARVRNATLALCVELRDNGVSPQQANDVIRSIAQSAGLDPMCDPVSDAVRWCIDHYFDLPLHD